MSGIIFSDWFDIFGSTNVDDVGMCVLSDGRYIAVWVDVDDSNKLKAIVLKIVGSEIYHGAVVTIEAAATGVGSCCKFSDNETKPRALISYITTSGDDAGEAKWVEVNTDDTITQKTKTNFYTPGAGDNAYDVKCCMLDENRAGIFYARDDGNDDLLCVTADANVAALTIGTQETIRLNVENSEGYLKAFQVDRDLAICMFDGDPDSYAAIAFFSDTEIIYDNNYKVFDTGTYPRGCALTYNKILVAGRNDTDSNYVNAKVCDMSTSWTYGADEMTNGDMDAGDVAAWTGVNATLSSIAGGESGNCMKLLENGGVNPTAYWDWVVPDDFVIYEVEFYVKAGDEASYEVSIYDVNTAATLCTIKENEATTEWTRQRFFFDAIDHVNNTRIILRQKCANGAGTYILFDSITIKTITNKTLTFGSAYTVEAVSGIAVSLLTLDSTHAFLGMYTAGVTVHKAGVLTINGTTVTGETLVEVPNSGEASTAELISVSGSLFKLILTYYDIDLDSIRSAICQWQSLPNIAGYCEVEGANNKLRLVLPEDADYSSLRVYKDGVALVADLVEPDPIFAPYPVRCYHPIHGVLAWRDDVDDQPLMIVKDSHADQTVDISLSLPAGKSLVINHGDGSHTDVAGPQVETTYVVTFGDTAAYNIFITGDLDSITYIKTAGEPISTVTGLNQLTALTNLSIYTNSSLKTVGRITALTLLEKIYLYGNDLCSLGPITSLTSLTYLRLADNALTDIGTVTNLTSLTYLYLGSNLLTDIGTVTNLTSLTYLHLAVNLLTDVGTIANLTSLTTVNLANNSLTDVGTVANLTSLTTLRLNNNSLTDIGTIANLTSLAYLYLGDNSLTGIGTVTNLTSLTTLSLGHNSLTDIGTVTNLTSLTYLNLANNSLTDVGTIANLTKSTYLNLANNSLTDVGTIANLTSLAILHLGNNSLTDVGTVTNLTSLTYLSLDYNSLTDIGTVANLTSLSILRLNNNNFDSSELSDYIDQAWVNRVALGASNCIIQIEDNAATPSCDVDAVAKIEGTGAYAGDGLKDAGCTVTYDA